MIRTARQATERQSWIWVQARRRYTDWLREFARAEGTDPEDLIERALSRFATIRGHAPPPMRIGPGSQGCAQ